MGKYKPTGKSYKFTTVKEIAEQLTLEQIDNFLIDFGKWLRLAKGDYTVDPTIQAMYEMVQALAKLSGEDPKDAFKQSTEFFGWNDDAEHHVSKITVQAVTEIPSPVKKQSGVEADHIA